MTETEAHKPVPRRWFSGDRLPLRGPQAPSNILPFVPFARTYGFPGDTLPVCFHNQTSSPSQSVNAYQLQRFLRGERQWRKRLR